MQSIEAVAVWMFWPVVTVALYLLSKLVYARRPSVLRSPLVMGPVLLIALALLLHTSYAQYFRTTSWLTALLGPATVAFAVPIYEQRALVRQYWPVLILGVTIGSITAMASAYGLATLLGLDESLRLSLMPRSITTPFAMVVSGDIGGVPAMTAAFVAVTGVVGGVLGEAILRYLPVRSILARGGMLGMGAHGVGVAKAYEIGREEGSIAGLVMVLVGITNILAAPLLGWLLHGA